MIDETLEDMIWRVVSRYAELSGAAVAMTPRRRTACSTGCSSRRCSATSPATSRRRSTTLVGQVHGLMPLTLAAS